MDYLSCYLLFHFLYGFRQVINNIRPRIDDIIITPISVDNEQSVIYIIDIPKGETAHQAQDLRYYKRFNFSSEPMQDYEIRDTMGRSKTPKFELSFLIEKTVSYYKDGAKAVQSSDGGVFLKDTYAEETKFALFITAKNTGSVYANYVNVFSYIPSFIVDHDTEDDNLIVEDGIEYYKDYEDNTVREIIGYKNVSPLHGSIPEFGPARYDPILPGLSRTWERPLNNLAELLPQGRFVNNEKLKWTIHADNAIPSSGEIYLAEIDFKETKEPPHA